MGIPFYECHISAPLEVCESRDPKGLYKKARAGEIADFTGITSPYQKPINPEIHIKTEAKSIKNCAEQIFDYLISKSLLYLFKASSAEVLAYSIFFSVSYLFF